MKQIVIKKLSNNSTLTANDVATLTDLFLFIGYSQEETDANFTEMARSVLYDPEKLKLEDLKSLPEPVKYFIVPNRLEQTIAFMGANAVLVKKCYEKINKFYNALQDVIKNMHKKYMNVSENKDLTTELISYITDSEMPVTRFLASQNVNNLYDEYVSESLQTILQGLMLPNTNLKLRIKGELIDLIKLADSKDRFAALNYIRMVLINLESLCQEYSKLNMKYNPDIASVIDKIAAIYRDYSKSIMDEGINLLKKSSDPKSLKRLNILDYNYQENLQYAIDNGLIDDTELNQGFFDVGNPYSNPGEELEETNETAEEKILSDESLSEQKYKKQTDEQKGQEAVDRMLGGISVDEDEDKMIVDTSDTDDSISTADEYESVVDQDIDIDIDSKDELLNETINEQIKKLKKLKNFDSSKLDNYNVDLSKILSKDILDLIDKADAYFKNKKHRENNRK